MMTLLESLKAEKPIPEPFNTAAAMINDGCYGGALSFLRDHFFSGYDGKFLSYAKICYHGIFQEKINSGLCITTYDIADVEFGSLTTILREQLKESLIQLNIANIVN